ncbi:anaphase-promoting complex subunit cdc27 [Coemansia sp. RSA 1822]|nr:anaphase-promoting complex subunit cdc27 [Coemansia sp. RSA 1853]KAJ2566510.1 anaphase-promoting complex subunit cdc27 [Coemansia sp. RSA 1822]
MLGNPTTTANRKRAIRAAPVSARPATSLPSNTAGSKCTKQHSEASQLKDLTRPQTETERHSYERLVHRGITLLQPYSVLFVAETYHGWYHSAGTDVAGSILQQTVGLQNKRSDGRDDDNAFDVRSVYWLALCYWHLGEINSAYALLSPLSVEAEYIIEKSDVDSEHGSDESALLRSKKALACGLWLLAMSCTRLEKWQEAEDHLHALQSVIKLLCVPDEPGSENGADMRQSLKSNSSLYAVPLTADVSDLLGLVCLRTNRFSQSEAHSGDALRRNPLLWSSFRRLCDQGSTKQLVQALAFNMDAPKDQSKKSPGPAEVTPGPAKKSSVAVRPQPGRGRTTELADLAANTRAHTRLASRTTVSRSVGNTSSNTSSNNSTAGGVKAVLGPKHSVRGAALSAKTPARSRASVLAASEKKRTRNGAVRSSSISRMREPSAATTRDTVTNEALVGNSQDGVSSIHQLFKRSALACIHMSSYRATQGLLAYSELPIEQQNSVWGLCMLGRICFEAGRYPEAAQAFGEAHRMAPYRVRDMDTYSTLLWHTKHEEALAQLAHKMVSVGRNTSPEAWIAVANCFSLDGDHASALKSLARSIQLYKSSHCGTTSVPRNDAGGSGGLAYAHTLVGHENVALDELDRAQRAFRTAIRIDPRHYNAWYGLGMSYLRLGKPDLAEYHFKRALALNSQNPLLLQSSGAVYEYRKDYVQALRVYERVERMLNDGAPARDDGSTGCDALLTDSGVVLSLRLHHAMNFVMFKRARVLVVLEQFGTAARVLEQLLRRCPREFNVPFLLGQTYTKLRKYREAAACLTRALDIAPENSQSVREAFDALYEQDTGEAEPDMDNSENVELGCGSDSGMNILGGMDVGDILTSSEPGSPYFDSPSLYAGRDRNEWRSDWRALGNADDRVDRALDFE